ncbi:Mediator of RNA polymerase II transcription subunit [Trichinella pseudospiralis]
MYLGTRCFYFATLKMALIRLDFVGFYLQGSLAIARHSNYHQCFSIELCRKFSANATFCLSVFFPFIMKIG